MDSGFLNESLNPSRKATCVSIKISGMGFARLNGMNKTTRILLSISCLFLISATPLTANISRKIERDFSAKPGHSVVIEVHGAGDVSLQLGESDSLLRFEIELIHEGSDPSEAEEQFDRTNVSFEESPDAVALFVKNRQENKGWRLWRSGSWPKVRILVTCPPHVSINANTHSGSIHAKDIGGTLSFDTGSGGIQVIDCQGNLSADTGSGSIKILRFSGTVHADTGSGSVIARDVHGNVSVDTGSGSVELTGAIASFQIDTGSGSVALHSSAPIETTSSADTGSGSISASFPPDSPLKLNLTTGSGSIRADVPNLLSIRSSKRSFTAHTDPNAPTLRLSTGSGSVRVVSTPR